MALKTRRAQLKTKGANLLALRDASPVSETQSLAVAIGPFSARERLVNWFYCA
jgi:hypothetical protein